MNLLESSSVTCDPVFSPEAIFSLELRANKQVLKLCETVSSSLVPTARSQWTAGLPMAVGGDESPMDEMGVLNTPLRRDPIDFFSE